MKAFVGQVAGTKMAKTAVVLVKQTKVHPIYRKRTVMVKKYHVHDEFGVVIGDRVEFMPCRPMAKTKRWQITKVLNRQVSLSAKAKEVKPMAPVKITNPKKTVTKTAKPKGKKK